MVSNVYYLQTYLIPSSDSANNDILSKFCSSSVLPTTSPQISIMTTSADQKAAAEAAEKAKVSAAVKAAFEGAINHFGSLEGLSFVADQNGIRFTTTGTPKAKKDEEESVGNVNEQSHFTPFEHGLFSPKENEFCGLCSSRPCVSKGLYDGLVETGDELEQDKLTNKEICYRLYEQATRKLHGYLGAGN